MCSRQFQESPLESYYFFDDDKNYISDTDSTNNYISDHDSTTMETLRPNETIGSPLITKSKNTLRLFFQNVNSIDLDKSGGDFHTICNDIQLTETDILMLAEPNICHRHGNVQDILHRTAARELQHSLILLSSSKLKYRSYKKPGGTLMVTHGKTRGRVYQKGTDDYGRWSWLTLKGKTNTVTIITLYQVGDSTDYLTNTKKGCKTVRLQLYAMGLKDNRKGTPRDVFLQDLTSFVTQKQELSHKIIICGDFNETFKPGFQFS